MIVFAQAVPLTEELIRDGGPFVIAAFVLFAMAMGIYQFAIRPALVMWQKVTENQVVSSADIKAAADAIEQASVTTAIAAGKSKTAAELSEKTATKLETTLDRIWMREMAQANKT